MNEQSPETKQVEWEVDSKDDCLVLCRVPVAVGRGVIFARAATSTDAKLLVDAYKWSIKEATNRLKEELDFIKTEHDIAKARLRGEVHPKDNGDWHGMINIPEVKKNISGLVRIIAADTELIQKDTELVKQLAQALQKIGYDNQVSSVQSNPSLNPRHIAQRALDLLKKEEK